MFYLVLFLCCSGAWLYVHELLAFQGWYGPAGIKSLTALFQGNYSWDAYTKIVHYVDIWTGFGPILSSYFVSYLGYMMTCLGIALLADQWFSIRYKIIPSIILYAPLMMIAQLIGPDAICIGMVFLGLGMAKQFIPISGVLWFSSVQIKSIGLPALMMIPIILPWTWLTLPFAIPFSLPTIEHIPQHTITLLSKTTTLYLILFSTASLLSILSKKRRIRNCVIIALVFLSCVYVSLKMSTKLRPRYLIAPTLPLLLIVTGELRHVRFGNVALTLFWIFLACDTWSFLYHWDQKFISNEGKISTILKPPAYISSLSSSMTDLVHSDHSTQGAQSLQELGHKIPKGGIVELRDTRHHHLIAPLAQKNKRFRIITPQNCCKPHESMHVCILRTLQEFNQSGGTLVLPSTLGHRIKEQRTEWIQTLIQEAQAFPSFEQYDSWWSILPAQYNNRTMPCYSKK